MPRSRRKVGILVGGGPAPGINSVIAAATIRAASEGYGVIGIDEGFSWIMRGDTTHTTAMSSSPTSTAVVRCRTDSTPAPATRQCSFIGTLAPEP